MKTYFTLILFCFFTTYQLNSQSNWVYIKKDSLGIEILPVFENMDFTIESIFDVTQIINGNTGLGINKSNSISRFRINPLFFLKYNSFTKFFHEDTNKLVYYFSPNPKNIKDNYPNLDTILYSLFRNYILNFPEYLIPTKHNKLKFSPRLKYYVDLPTEIFKPLNTFNNEEIPQIDTVLWNTFISESKIEAGNFGHSTDKILNYPVFSIFHINYYLLNAFYNEGAPDLTKTSRVFIDSKKYLWASTSKGLYKFANSSWTLNYTKHPWYIFENIALDSSIWIVTHGGTKRFLIQYKDNNQIIHKSKKLALDDYGTNLIPRIDFAGNIWIAIMPNNGYAKFDGKVWEYLSKENGLPGAPCKDRLRSKFFIDSKGGFWYIFCNGFNKFKRERRIANYFNNEWKFYNQEDIRSYIEDFNIIEDDNGNIIFVGHKKFILFDGTKFKSYRTKFKGIDQLFYDSNSNLWIISKYGLARLKNGILNDYTDSLNFPKVDYSKVNNSNTTLKEYKQLFEDSHGSLWYIRFTVSQNTTGKIFVESDDLYIDGYIGMFRNNQWEQISLPDYMGLSIFEDTNGNIWIDTPTYIYKYTH